MKKPHLTPIQTKIVQLLDTRPRTALELLEEIWWVHPQDAPDISCIKAHVYNTNARLCYHGYRIVCDFSGRGRVNGTGRGLGRTQGVYSLVKVKKHGDPKRKRARNPDARSVEGAQSASAARLD